MQVSHRCKSNHIYNVPRGTRCYYKPRNAPTKWYSPAVISSQRVTWGDTGWRKVPPSILEQAPEVALSCTFPRSNKIICTVFHVEQDVIISHQTLRRSNIRLAVISSQRITWGDTEWRKGLFCHPGTSSRVALIAPSLEAIKSYIQCSTWNKMSL